MTPATGSERAARYQWWTRRTERPLLVLAVAFLIVLAAPVLFPHMTRALADAVDTADVVIWVAFLTDYVVRVGLATDRRRFVATHKIELLAVAVPALRPLRLLRLLSVGQMVAARGRRNIAAEAGQLIAGSAILLVLVGAVAVLGEERGRQGANINTLGDALWWGATTITTVGYGDRYPVTTGGRLVAVALMVFGIALLGVITATIAAWFVRQVGEVAEQPLERRLDTLEAKVDRLLEALAAPGARDALAKDDV